MEWLDFGEAERLISSIDSDESCVQNEGFDSKDNCGAIIIVGLRLTGRGTSSEYISSV